MGAKGQRLHDQHPRKLRQREMATSYTLGLTIREIAMIYQVSTNTVHYALRTTNTPRRSHATWRKLNPELVQQIYAEHDGGDETSTSLARKHGVSQSYMSRLLRQRTG